MARVERETTVSPADVAFARDLDLQKTKIELEAAQLHNENERGLIDLRKKYGRNMIRFLWAYFVMATALIVLSGRGYLRLPDTVAVALVGGTAVSVLGVVGTIVAGLFRVKTP